MTATKERTWIPSYRPPDTARTVLLRLRDGTEVSGFYWRAEPAWYPTCGSKRRRNALAVVAWSEDTRYGI